VQVGTAFLATRQSAASPAHRDALSHGTRHTRLTPAFTGRLARALATDFQLDDVAPFPYQAMLTRPLLSAYWAGQSARLVQPDRDAVELLRSLVETTP
jgi:nitronate monooxygenase